MKTDSDGRLELDGGWDTQGFGGTICCFERKAGQRYIGNVDVCTARFSTGTETAFFDDISIDYIQIYSVFTREPIKPQPWPCASMEAHQVPSSSAVAASKGHDVG